MDRVRALGEGRKLNIIYGEDIRFVISSKFLYSPKPIYHFLVKTPNVTNANLQNTLIIHQYNVTWSVLCERYHILRNESRVSFLLSLFLRQAYMDPRLAVNSSRSWGWSWNSDSPVSASQMLGVHHIKFYEVLEINPQHILGKHSTDIATSQPQVLFFL